jgi:uncharacterized protein with HEPN domain
MDIKDLLKNLDKALVTEETATAIAEAFEKSVKEKSEAHISLAVEKALLEQDSDHATKLKHLVEKSDEDHCDKLKTVVKAITESHTNKLSKIVTFYKKSIDEKASKFSTKIIGDLDKFLSVYIEKKIPYTQIKEAVENTRARKQLAHIRKLVSFDPEMVQESVKTVVKDGKTKLDKMANMLNEANNENARLSRNMTSMKSAMLLEGKTKGMPSAKKDFVVKLLGDKDASYITENFKYVVEMFENGEQDETRKVAKEASKVAISRDAKIPTPSVISESTPNANKALSPVGGYLSELVRITK